MLNFQRSFRYSGPLATKPSPPKSQRFPLESIQETEVDRAPGKFAGSGTPFVPYVPAWSVTLDPLTQVHCPLAMFHFQRSFRYPIPLAAYPPKSQRFPVESVQETDFSRSPGTVSRAAAPFVPYVPI